jgi:hypothetical protein
LHQSCFGGFLCLCIGLLDLRQLPLLLPFLLLRKLLLKPLAVVDVAGV